MKDASDLEFLWTTPGGRYALLRSSQGDLIPFDTLRNEVQLIDDDELAEYVIEQMRKAGLPTIDPPRDPP
jgi:hypothetical protein